MAAVLWFVIIGLWFVETLRTGVSAPAWKNHHQVSFNRLAYELLQREKNQLAVQYCQAAEVVSYA